MPTKPHASLPSGKADDNPLGHLAGDRRASSPGKPSHAATACKGDLSMVRTTIRVGQRLRNWDGTRGYVTLNSRGIQVFGPGEPFMVEWLGLDGTVEDGVYYTLEDLEREGITFGRGVMPWAQ